MNTQNVQLCLGKVAEAKSWLRGRMGIDHPWSGLTTLPKRMDGSVYAGTNVLLLWMQQSQLNSTSPFWGSRKSLSQAGKPVGSGEKDCMAIYYDVIEVKVEEEDDFLGVSPAKNSPDAPPKMRRINILKPIWVFNEAQTAGYVRPADPPAGNMPDTSHWEKFARTYMENWKKLNSRKPLTGPEECFVQRFSRDLYLIQMEGVSANHIVEAYDADCCRAIDAADAGRLMKMAGVSQEILRAYTKAKPAAETPPSAEAVKPVPVPDPIPAPVPAPAAAAAPAPQARPDPFDIFFLPQPEPIKEESPPAPVVTQAKADDFLSLDW